MSASNASDDQADLSRDNFGNRNLHRYYTRDPGKIDLKAVIWVLLIGAAAGVGLGIAYAIIGYFASPFLLGHFSVRALCVAVCLCWLYGAQLGRLTERALRAKKVRSAAVWFAVLVFVVLLSLYISWVCTATLTTTGTLFDAKNLTGFSRWMNPQALAKFALNAAALLLPHLVQAAQRLTYDRHHRRLQSSIDRVAGGIERDAPRLADGGAGGRGGSGYRGSAGDGGD